VPGRFGACAGALGAVSVLLLAPVASARQNGVLVVKPSTILRLSGTDMYCSIYSQSGITGVACLHLPNGPTSKSGKGYQILATEKGVVVLPPGANKPSRAYAEPSLTSLAKIAGGDPHAKTLTIAGNDVVGISETHMAVYSTPKVGGDAGIGVIYVDPKYRLVVGSYTGAITDKYVTVIEITAAGKSKVIYRHAVY
jgi:hypothetical protein